MIADLLLTGAEHGKQKGQAAPGKSSSPPNAYKVTARTQQHEAQEAETEAQAQKMHRRNRHKYASQL